MLRDFDPARMRMRVARRKPYVNDQNQSITPPQEATLGGFGSIATALRPRFTAFPGASITRNDSY